MLILLFLLTQPLTQEWISFLNSSHVRDMVSNGNLIYAATTGGALIFNKEDTSFTPITNVDGLRTNDVRRVATDKYGNVWFLCWGEADPPYGGITVRSPDGSIRMLTSRNGLPSYKLSAIFIDGDTVRVGIKDEYYDGVWVFDIKGDSFTDSSTGEKHPVQPSNEVNEIVVIGDSVWFGTNKGIGVIEKGATTWTTYDATDGLPNDTVLAITSWDGSIWVGTKGGIARLTPGGWVGTYTFSGSIYDFCTTDTDLWAASDEGILKWSGTNWEEVSGLGFNSRSVIFDSILWVGTWGRGIVKYNGIPHIHTPEGPASNFILAVALHQDRSIWAIHGWAPDIGKTAISKLYYYNGKWRWKIYNEDNEWGAGGAGANYIAIDKKGNVWVTFWDGRDAPQGMGLVKILPNDSVVKFRFEGSGNPNVLNGICVDEEDNVWVGCWDDWIRKIEGNSVGKVYPFEEPAGLLFDLEGNLYAGSTQGLAVFPKDGSLHFIQLPSAEETSPVFVTWINEVWVRTKGGMAYKLKDEEVVSEYRPDLMGGPVFDVAMDPRGGIWFAVGGVGIKRLLPEGHYSNYKIEDGLVSSTVLDLEFDVKNGILWVATGEGLSRFNTGIVPPTWPQVKVYPNPFISSLGHEKITFESLGIEGGRINIYTLSGRFIRNIDNIENIFAYWNGKDENGKSVASGVYIFVVYTEENAKQVGKIAIVR